MWKLAILKSTVDVQSLDWYWTSGLAKGSWQMAVIVQKLSMNIIAQIISLWVELNKLCEPMPGIRSKAHGKWKKWKCEYRTRYILIPLEELVSAAEGLFWVSPPAAHGKSSSGSGWQTPLLSSLQQTQRKTHTHHIKPIHLLRAGHTTISHREPWH